MNTAERQETLEQENSSILEKAKGFLSQTVNSVRKDAEIDRRKNNLTVNENVASAGFTYKEAVCYAVEHAKAVGFKTSVEENTGKVKTYMKLDICRNGQMCLSSLTENAPIARQIADMVRDDEMQRISVAFTLEDGKPKFELESLHSVARGDLCKAVLEDAEFAHNLEEALLSVADEVCYEQEGCSFAEFAETEAFLTGIAQGQEIMQYLNPDTKEFSVKALAAIQKAVGKDAMPGNISEYLHAKPSFDYENHVFKCERRGVPMEIPAPQNPGFIGEVMRTCSAVREYVFERIPDFLYEELPTAIVNSVENAFEKLDEFTDKLIEPVKLTAEEVHKSLEMGFTETSFSDGKCNIPLASDEEVKEFKFQKMEFDYTIHEPEGSMSQELYKRSIAQKESKLDMRYVLAAHPGNLSQKELALVSIYLKSESMSFLTTSVAFFAPMEQVACDIMSELTGKTVPSEALEKVIRLYPEEINKAAVALFQSDKPEIQKDLAVISNATGVLSGDSKSALTYRETLPKDAEERKQAIMEDMRKIYTVFEHKVKENQDQCKE